MNRVYQALGHPTRRQILALLRERDRTAGEIAEHFDLAKPTLSGHFAVLREARLISGDRNGTSITYRLNVSLLEEALLGLLDMFDVGQKEGVVNRKPGLWATAIAVVVMAGLSLWAAAGLPERVPVQWGFDGEVGRYGSRVEALVALPLVAVGVGLLFAVLPRIEPRRDHLEQSARAFNAVWIAAITLLVAIHAAVLLAGLGRDVSIPSLALVGIGLLFLVIGNYLGKVRSNWFLGIRTPWTLSSERSWDRTHRLGGRLFAVLGALVLVTALFSTSIANWVAGAGGMTVAVVTVVYSYVVWRDDPDRASART